MKLIASVSSAVVAERTKAPLLSRTVFMGRGGGLNPVSAKMCYLLLLFREFHSGLTKPTLSVELKGKV